VQQLVPWSSKAKGNDTGDRTEMLRFSMRALLVLKVWTRSHALRRSTFVGHYSVTVFCDSIIHSQIYREKLTVNTELPREVQGQVW
jgi:hypothetical protein